ncbi:hypothetical protein FNF29_06106 [Cafeteria roenbergensis]|uniref:Uncharacterized protein n=1 Tax=Cafeteria roenbergensis TaxID=33653 RepID=A0A5A8C9D7_CAFRO|nr:hypothetical protein FNF29_06106 [Cafeteria roenbergensis]|eukprot:KAA0149219.1 hypothetical protein FNF29_06106 [Cafeteria roenbergensis]
MRLAGATVLLACIACAACPGLAAAAFDATSRSEAIESLLSRVPAVQLTRSKLSALAGKLRLLEQRILSESAERETDIRTRIVSSVLREERVVSAAKAVDRAIDDAVGRVQLAERAASVRILRIWPVSEAIPLLQMCLLMTIPFVAVALWNAYSAWTHPAAIEAEKARRASMFSSQDLRIQAPPTKALLRHRSGSSYNPTPVGGSGGSGFAARLAQVSPPFSAVSPAFGSDGGGATPKTPRFEL